MGLASGEESIISHVLFQRLLLVPLETRLLHTFCERRVGGAFDFVGVAKKCSQHPQYFSRGNKVRGFFEE